MGVPKTQDAKNWAGLDVLDRDGTHIGTCTALYVDEATDQPEWLSVDRTDGPTAFVPVLEATERDGRVHLAFAARAIAEAPTFGSPSKLSQEEEATLYRHYGVPFSDSGSLLPTEGASDQLPTSADDASTDRPPSADAATVPVVAQVDLAAEPVLSAPPVVTSTPIELAVVEQEVDLVEPAPQVVVPPPAMPPPAMPPPAMLPPMGPSRVPALAAGAVALAGVLAAAAVLRHRRRERSRPSAQLVRKVRGGSAAVTARATQVARTAGAAAGATSGAAAGAGRSVRAGTASTVKSGAKKASRSKDRAQKVGRRKARAQQAVASRVASQAAAGGTRAASAVRSVPEAVAARGHRARKSWHATVTELLAVLSGGAGYVLGARAGHDRYREIQRGAARLADSPDLPEPLRRPAAAVSGALRQGEHGV